MISRECHKDFTTFIKNHKREKEEWDSMSREDKDKAIQARIEGDEEFESRFPESERLEAARFYIKPKTTIIQPIEFPAF